MSEQDNALSFGKGVPDESLRSKFGSVSVRTPCSPEHGCRIVLPKGSASATGTEPAKISVGACAVLAGYQLESEAMLQVMGTDLPFEVNLVDWLEFETGRRGVKLQVVRSAVDDNGQIVHALGVEADRHRQRLVVRSNGPHVLFLVGRETPNAGPLVTETLGLAAASLDLTLPLRKKTLELLKRWRSAEGGWHLVYPESWSVRDLATPRATMSAVEVRLSSASDTIAYIRVVLDKDIPLGTTGRARFCARLTEELQQSGVTPKDMAPLGASLAKKQLERFVGGFTAPTGEGMVAVAVEPAKQGWFGYVMVCPGKEMNPIGWMRGKRAFDIVVSTTSE